MEKVVQLTEGSIPPLRQTPLAMMLLWTYGQVRIATMVRVGLYGLL